jgi:hypothetical protein
MTFHHHPLLKYQTLQMAALSDVLVYGTALQVSWKREREGDAHHLIII